MDCVYISEGSYNKQFRKREIRRNVNEKNEMIVSLILCFTMLCPAVTYASENEK